MVGFQGDVPCFYHTLLLPAWMWAWFVVSSVSAQELVDYLEKHHGTKVCLEPGQIYVSICVALMGWSWGCWLGQTVLEDLLARVPNLKSEWRLMYGGPLPRFLLLLGQALHFQYIDDFGGFLMLLPDVNGLVDLGEVEKVLRLCIRILRKHGFGCHKTVISHRVEPLGVVVEDRKDAIVVEVCDKKYGILDNGSRYLLKQRRCSGKDMERFLGHWVNSSLLVRVALSIFHSCYEFMKRHKGQTKEVPLWRSALAEIWVAVSLLPLLRSVISAGWWLGAYVSDASTKGGALLESKATLKEVMREAAWAEVKGWFVKSGRPKVGGGRLSLRDALLVGEGSVGADSSDVVEEMSFTDGALQAPLLGWRPAGRTLPVAGPRLEERRQFRGVFDWRAGFGRMARQLLQCGVPWVESSDPVWCPGADVREAGGAANVCRLIKAGLYGFVLLNPRVGSFSALRRPPLRNPHHPTGAPWLNEEKDLEEVESGNVEVSMAVAILKLCWSLGVKFALLHPQSSLIWLTSAMLGLAELSGLVYVNVDQCELGASIKGSIRMVSNLSSLSSLGSPCSGGHTHESLVQRPATVEKRERNPDLSKELCEALSRLVSDGVVWERERRLPLTNLQPEEIGTMEENEEEEEESLTMTPPMPHPKGARGPPALSSWSDRRRWRRVVCLKWRKNEHINKQELRMLTMGIRHASRCPDRRGKRIVLLSDSLVAIGAVAKGRSSAAGLNTEVRRVASHVLGVGTKIYPRYIHTSRNCADGPSRGRRIGVVLHAKD